MDIGGRLPDARQLIPALTLLGLLAAGGLWLAGWQSAASMACAATVVVALVPLAISVGRDLVHGETGVDLIALLAMGGSLILGQYVAGAVVALMLSGGQALEQYAARRARHELSSLLARAPRTVNLYTEAGLAEVAVSAVRAGDRLLVKPGDVVPVDGLLEGRGAVLDESALTGESRPVEHLKGDRVASGVVNAGPPFDLRAQATAERSTYAAIVRLVESAQAAKAPFVRLADRYALWFLPLTLGVAAIAWAVSGSAVRALAVLVVATPCPLILAAPIAIVAGISRAASRGVIVKGGGALETLGRARTLVFDKTGTLTTGEPRVADVISFGEATPDDLLRLAASLDQVSSHVFARAIVSAARERGLVLEFPSEVKERAGLGIRGVVAGRQLTLGRARWLAGDRPMPEPVARLRRRTEREGSSSVFIGVDGAIAGALVVDDALRTETPHAIQALRRDGIRRILVLTGDREEVARPLARALGADTVLWERTPQQKVDAVLDECRAAVTVMVGDGINDAPALAAADVGIAMGARGATASSEAADAVVMVDRLDRVAEAIAIARHARGVALQSVLAGMALSGGGMVLAALGWLPPVAGAIFQEAIDVAVILNALRALGGGERRRLEPGETVVQQQITVEHRALRPLLERLRDVADHAASLDAPKLERELNELEQELTSRLLPHEQNDSERLFPLVDRMIGKGATATLARAHLEIENQVAKLRGLTQELHERGAPRETVHEVQSVLYGLHAILTLHFAQEEEGYLALLTPPDTQPRPA